MGNLRQLTIGCAVTLALGAVSCKREFRGFTVDPPAANAIQKVQVSELQPGSNIPPAAVTNQYEQNAFALSEGKRLFTSFNCSGCHAHGGGGMGPPLMDEKWIYGSNPEQVFSTIIQGRPNGMPAFGGKIPEYEVWQLAAYVRSLSGLAAKTAAPGRDDHMNGPPPENSAKKQQPRNSSTPPAADMPL